MVQRESRLEDRNRQTPEQMGLVSGRCRTKGNATLYGFEKKMGSPEDDCLTWTKQKNEQGLRISDANQRIIYLCCDDPIDAEKTNKRYRKAEILTFQTPSSV